MSASQRPEPGSVPTFYANGANLLSGVYDFQIEFSLATTPTIPPAGVARVHLSPQLAKVIGRLLRRNVKAYEEQTGTKIQLPEEVVKQLNIADLDE
jgi:hypothetical protein